MSLAPGARLGPYEILGPIGAGGMGDVYKARDTRLERTVAIKVSKEAFSERFRNEALAVAALNHPHICTLHDVGPDYLVMEYVDGKPLRGPLPGPGGPAPRRPDRGRARARAPARGSSTATSSRRTSWSRRAASRCSTSAWPSGAHRGSRRTRAEHTLTEEGVIAGDAALHGAGADRGQARRRAHGHLRARSGAVRAADGRAGVRGEERGERDGGDPGEGAAADLGPEARHSARARGRGAGPAWRRTRPSAGSRSAS